MNLILSILSAAAACAGTACVDALEQDIATDLPAHIEITVSGEEPNYTYDGERPQRQEPHFPVRRPRPRDTREETDDAELRYLEKKRELDADFARMFKLKRELDKTQSVISAAWEEYYALSQAYNERLRELVASWATDKLYN